MLCCVPKEGWGILAAIFLVAVLAFLTTILMVIFYYAPASLFDPTLTITAMAVPLLLLMILPTHFYCTYRRLGNFKHYAAGALLILSVFYYVIPPTSFPFMGYQRSMHLGRMPGERSVSSGIVDNEELTALPIVMPENTTIISKKEVDELEALIFSESKKAGNEIGRTIDNSDATPIPPLRHEVEESRDSEKSIASFYSLIRFAHIVGLYLSGLLCMFVFWRIAVYKTPTQPVSLP